MSVGTEWLIDAAGCRADALRDIELFQRLFGIIIADLKLKAIGDQVWHRFPAPGGLTGLVLLTESHLACHTYPEFNAATINLYCCRTRPDWPWAERLAEMLDATTVNVQTIERGIALSNAAISEAPITVMRGSEL